LELTLGNGDGFHNWLKRCFFYQFNFQDAVVKGGVYLIGIDAFRDSEGALDFCEIEFAATVNGAVFFLFLLLFSLYGEYILIYRDAKIFFSKAWSRDFQFKSFF
jgi:hypothetical protein